MSDDLRMAEHYDIKESVATGQRIDVVSYLQRCDAETLREQKEHPLTPEMLKKPYTPDDVFANFKAVLSTWNRDDEPRCTLGMLLQWQMELVSATSTEAVFIDGQGYQLTLFLNRRWEFRWKGEVSETGDYSLDWFNVR